MENSVEAEVYGMWNTQLDHKGHVTGKTGKQKVEFFIDTGATLSLLNFVLQGALL